MLTVPVAEPQTKFETERLSAITAKADDNAAKIITEAQRLAVGQGEDAVLVTHDGHALVSGLDLSGSIFTPRAVRTASGRVEGQTFS